jgi:PglZ domain
MGIVSDAVRKRIFYGIKHAGIVVWFDPQHHYIDIVESISIPDGVIVRYDGSFFALRRSIDDRLNNDTRPRILVYVPLAEDATDHALIELTSLGTIYSPTASGEQCTALKVIVQEALADQLPYELLNQLLAQLDHLTLAEIDHQAEQSMPKLGILNEIFGTGDSETMLLTFLTNPFCDERLQTRGALPDLLTLLEDCAGCSITAGDGVAIRDQMAQWLLQTDLLATLHDPPSSLISITAARDERQRALCLRLVTRWRQASADSYLAQAERVAALLGIADQSLTIVQMSDCWTFAAIDHILVTQIEKMIAQQPGLLSLARARLSGFWAKNDQTLLQRWQIVVTAGDLCDRVARVTAELDGRLPRVNDMIVRYTDGDDAWCLADTQHRQLEILSRWLGSARQPDQPDTSRELVVFARQRYARMVHELGTLFMKALRDTNYVVASTPRQQTTFALHVQSALQEGKTAYLLIDALRYEMGRDLATRIIKESTFTAKLIAGMGTPPTITPVGMAALMPGGEDLQIRAHGNKLEVAIRNTVLSNRDARIKWLKSQSLTNAMGTKVQIQETTLDDLLEANPKHAKWTKADLILVTSQEIDALGETEFATFRQTMEALLDHIVQACRLLTRMGVATIIITADHGHLYVPSQGEDMTIAAPGGETAMIHRRVWVGHGGAQDAGYLRMSLSQFGIRTDLDFAVPWGTAMFSAPGGNTAYFHGGLSPQELLIPLITVQTTASKDADRNSWKWEIHPRSNKITTGVITATLTATAKNLLKETPPAVQIELRAGHTNIGRVLANDDIKSQDIIVLPLPDDDSFSISQEFYIEVTNLQKPTKEVQLVVRDVATGRDLSIVPLTWAIAL